MAEQGPPKTEPPSVSNDEEPAWKKRARLALTSVVPSPTGDPSLFLRPLAEPPILCYSSIIEFVEETPKEMKEKPHLYSPDIGTRMRILGFSSEMHVNWTRRDWAEDMLGEAKVEGKREARGFYVGLLMALIGDYREDEREHGGWIREVYGAAVGDEDGLKGDGESEKAGSELELSDDSGAYLTANEGDGGMTEASDEDGAGR